MDNKALKKLEADLWDAADNLRANSKLTSKKGGVKMSDLQELTNELMEDPDFRREYEALQPERDITIALVKARKEAGLTQIQLSEKTGISQADISRLENGSRNPSLALLQRIAEALNSTLRIEFIPNKTPAR